MLYIYDIVKFRLHDRLRHFEALDSKLKEMGVEVIRGEPHTSVFHGHTIESYFWTCETKKNTFDELCEWLKNEYKGYAYIRILYD